MGLKRLSFVLLLLLLACKPQYVEVQKEENVSADIFEEINANLVSGGPPKDGIPAIDNPKYISAQEADKVLTPDDKVAGLIVNNQAYAYPIDILYWHEVVNEDFNGRKISITYCPLTGSIQGFEGFNLGVSGKLYNSNLVLYDRETDSEIPQIMHVAVNGPLTGTKLYNIPVVVTTWQRWKAKHPDTKVLSRETGFDRDYDRNPYPGYDDVLRIWFPVKAKSDRFHTKKIVHGVELDGKYLAIPKEEFKQVKEATYLLGNKEILIKYNEELDVIETYYNNTRLPSFDLYWFAWYAYYPDTEVLE